MLERCDFLTERECSCGPDQCRVQNIGRFTKSTDRTLNTVLAKDRAGWAVRYGIAVTIALISIGTAGALLGKELVRMDRQFQLEARV